jgi:hypothetical protein
MNMVVCMHPEGQCGDGWMDECIARNYMSRQAGMQGESKNQLNPSRLKAVIVE